MLFVSKIRQAENKPKQKPAKKDSVKKKPAKKDSAKTTQKNISDSE